MPSPSIRAGIWRCAMPRAPRQLPSLPPPNRAIQKPGANSPLDKIWGQGQRHYKVNGVIEIGNETIKPRDNDEADIKTASIEREVAQAFQAHGV
jgi:hypothetical protein